ncbi:MAG TPA: 2-oxo acid dehydrogenase subunit E2 [Candidatus Rothia avistercoris]|uniref:Dihydrolipoamide acetyltransferase component of pyruvate dehydrogenase complex n=1 Tax=Candidatus Rothia avistercoris TaxID=2840479 RepID=A0A9D2ZT44_9MICC|nr:dihydrolipoamide acetyltransferase family protein [Rothia nasimurium]HJD51743.1 2-oxo acid dehydrogenase subunit E2 [Candidatus Rothia avistercoris]
MSQIFNLPDVGEGLTEAEILSWKVAPGDTVEVNDVLVEIETAKSVVELPSPYEGTVQELLVAEGETVEVGTPIIAIAGEGTEAGGGSRPAAERPDAAPQQAAAPAGEQGGGNALVGSGPKADPVKRRARKKTAATHPVATRPAAVPQPEAAVANASAPVPAAAPLPTDSRRQLLTGLPARAGKLLGEGSKGVLRRLGSQDLPAETGTSEVPRRQPLAKPPVRKAAQDMGIDLAQVTPTGDQGQVTKRDLLNYAAHLSLSEQANVTDTTDPKSFWIPAGVGGDRIERIKVKGVRKATAKAMVESAFKAPHVSIFVDVDATRTMEFVKRLKKSPQFEGVKVTPLLILAKAVIWATARTPQVNATWTDSEIQIKHFMNLGIAAATPRGLMVPNIKDAQTMNLRELALALNDLTTRAREGKTQPAEMQQGTMTITNIGSLGIDTGTPIINPGEAAIIAFGTIKQKPWVVDGEVIPRWVTTLGGSFDHRVLDGDLSAKFLADVASILEEPALLLDM